MNGEKTKRTELNRSLCAHCNVEEGTKRCSGCKQTYYCSKECQTKHWQIHKKKCKQIRRKKAKRNTNTKPKQHGIYKSMAQSMFLESETSNNQHIKHDTSMLQQVMCLM